jgi:hypothetical protein
MSLKPMELIALHDGSQGYTELMEKLEMEVNFLLKREKRVIRDLAGVVMDLRDNSLGKTELDMELAVQGLGDSLHDWDSEGRLPATALTELESTPQQGSTQRLASEATQKVGWFCKDRLALDDIAAEAWKRLHFGTVEEDSDLDAVVLAAILSETRDLLRGLEAKGQAQVSLIHEEWGEQ